MSDWKSIVQKLKQNECGFTSCDPTKPEGFSILCSLLNDQEWASLINDLIINPSQIRRELSIPRDPKSPDEEAIVEMVSEIEELSAFALDNLSRALEGGFLSKILKNEIKEANFIDNIFYIILSTPVVIKTEILQKISHKETLPLDIRFDAASRLCLQKVKMGKEYWMQLARTNPKSRLAPLAIAALAESNLQWAWELIKTLEINEIPGQFKLNYKTSFRTFIRELKAQEEKKAEIQFPLYMLPTWGISCVDSLLKEKEFRNVFVISEPPPFKDSNLKTIKVGISPFLETSIFELGVEQGFYLDQGINVEIKKPIGWDRIFAELDSGKVDMIIGNRKICQLRNKQFQSQYHPNYKYRHSKNLFLYNGFSILVRQDSDISTYSELLNEKVKNNKPWKSNELIVETLKQLKGKVIIASRYTDHLLSVLLCARKAKLEQYEDFNIIEKYDPDEGLQKFINGVGHAYVGGIPQNIIARKRGIAKELINQEQISIKQLIQSNVFVSLSRSPVVTEEIIEKFENAWFNSVRQINESYVEENYGLVEEVIEKFNSNLNDISNNQIEKKHLADQKFSIKYKFVLEDFKAFWQKLGVFPIPATVDIDLFETLAKEMDAGELEEVLSPILQGSDVVGYPN